jgi:hypothetical protein
METLIEKYCDGIKTILRLHFEHDVEESGSLTNAIQSLLHDFASTIEDRATQPPEYFKDRVL